MNKYADLVRQSLSEAHDTLEKTMEGVTDEVAHFLPEGKALPIAAAYIHTIVSEDALLNGWVRHEKLLVEDWAEKMGVSIPHPPMDADWEKNFAKWAREVKLDMAKFREYAKAVRANTDKYLQDMSDEDLMEKKVDLSAWGMGEWPLAKFVVNMLSSHVHSLTGEISAVKGLQNLKGYPF